MNSNINEATPRFSPRAGLVALAHKWQALNLFDPIAQQVQIKQKTVKYSPLAKLQVAFLAILAGSRGLVELNKTVRADQILWQAFGLEGCAEQSVVQETLDKCNAENVQQMRQALDQIYRQFSQGYHHNYAQRWQILDADFSGLPCGPKAALALPGYFVRQRNRKGRQLARVIATRYEEVVVEQVYPGNVQLNTAFATLIEAAEKTLSLDQAKRRRTIIRVDSGAGSIDNINWALSRGYYYHGKDYSGQRAKALSESVQAWLPDPANAGREVGWISAPHPYNQPVVRIAVRCRKANGQWGIGVIVSNLSAEMVIELTGLVPAKVYDPEAVLLAYVKWYDQRGGGIETEIKEDRQGLGLGSRNKKRFEAQQMVILLGALAHNVAVWSRKWLSESNPPFQGYGIHRLVRDLFTLSGAIWLDSVGHISQIILNQFDPFAAKLVKAFCPLLASEQVAVSLGKT